MPDPDLASFPVARRGRRFEDFEVGQRLDHHWGRTINAGDNSVFTTTTLAFTPLYFNAEYARAHGYEGVVVHPLLVLSTVVGLSVEDLSEAGGPFLGVDDVRFERPVYEGDTLTARSTVVDKRTSKKRQGFGIVTWATEGWSQKGERVISYRRTNLCAMRGTSLS